LVHFWKRLPSAGKKAHLSIKRVFHGLANLIKELIFSIRVNAPAIKGQKQKESRAFVKAERKIADTSLFGPFKF
jgi:hypothetical protein